MAFYYWLIFADFQFFDISHSGAFECLFQANLRLRYQVEILAWAGPSKALASATSFRRFQEPSRKTALRYPLNRTCCYSLYCLSFFRSDLTFWDFQSFICIRNLVLWFGWVRPLNLCFFEFFFQIHLSPQGSKKLDQGFLEQHLRAKIQYLGFFIMSHLCSSWDFLTAAHSEYSHWLL